MVKKKHNSFKKVLKRIGLRWPVLILVTIFFLFLMWLWLQNPEKRAAKPLEAALSSLHPSLICDDGVGRFGIDSGPWYDVYLNVDVAAHEGSYEPSLDAVVRSVAHRYGYNLQVDTSRINSIANSGPNSLPGETLDANGLNQYYVGSNGSNRLNVAIIYTGTEPTVCTGYIQPGHANFPIHGPQHGRAMLELGLYPL